MFIDISAYGDYFAISTAKEKDGEGSISVKPKIYEMVRMNQSDIGSKIISIRNVYNGEPLVSSIDISNVRVNGTIYEDAVSLSSALAPILFNKGGGTGNPGGAGIEDIVQGSNITIDKSNPKRPIISAASSDVEFTELEFNDNTWHKNQFLNIRQNKFLRIDTSVKSGILLVKQNSVGGYLLSVESQAIDINTEPNSTTLIHYFLFGGNVAFSVDRNIVDFLLPQPDLEQPSTPTIEVVNVSGNSVTLTWEPSTDNTYLLGYNIFQNDVILKTVKTPNVIIDGLYSNTMNVFKIQAQDTSGNVSDFSNEVTVNTSLQDDVNPTFLPENAEEGFSTIKPGVYKHTIGSKSAIASESLLNDGYIEFGTNIEGDMAFILDSNNSVSSIPDPSNYQYSVIISKSTNKYSIEYHGQTSETIDLGFIGKIKKFRLVRNTSQVKLLLSTDGIVFTEKYAFTTTSNANLYVRLSSKQYVPAETESLMLVNQ